MAKTSRKNELDDPKVAPNTFARGAKEFRHDLFKSDLQKMKKNTSFKKGVITIVELDHVHIFHSHNSQGKEQEHTNAVGGHFHKVTVKTNADGDLVARSGPALRQVFKKKASGTKRVIQAVTFIDGDADDDNAIIVDNHTHEFIYEGSENLSGSKISALQRTTQAAIASSMPREELPSKAEPEQDRDLGLEDISND